MKKVLNNLEPIKVFEYFEEITSIPRGSGNCKNISKYLINFAIDHDFVYDIDGFDNITIFKKSQNYNSTNSKAVILQAHMDMVCNSLDSSYDMTINPPQIIVDKDRIHADNTTLGADDGIGMAMILAILDDDNISHPNLECIFTVDEEIGLIGATNYDASKLDFDAGEKKMLINLDSEEEGVFTIGCAGGADAIVTIPFERINYQGKLINFSINGLKGGHSGIDIYEGRINALFMMSCMISALNKVSNLDSKILSFNGGVAKNVIPSSAECIVATRNIDKAVITAKSFINFFKNEFKYNDNEINLDIKIVDASNLGVDIKPISLKSSKEIGDFLNFTPNGIYTIKQRENKDLEEELSDNKDYLVESSVNLGVIKTLEDKIMIEYGLRSSDKEKLDELIEIIDASAAQIGGSTEIKGRYKEWQPNFESGLLVKVMDAYKKLYSNGPKPEIEVTHAGLECGCFSDKISNIDAISFGPTISGAHTVNESLDIASVGRTYNLLKEILCLV